MIRTQRVIKQLALRLRQGRPPRDENPQLDGQWHKDVAAVRAVAIPPGFYDMFDELAGFRP